MATWQELKRELTYCCPRFRNDNLIKNGFEPQQATKTGTTIVGAVFKDGVVIGADTRATSDNIVVDKGCQKIYYIQENI